MRDPGTSSTVRCSRIRLTCGSLKGSSARAWRRWHTLKTAASGRRGTRTFVLNAEQEYYAIYSAKNALLHDRGRLVPQPGAALFGACDASRAPISRRTVLECTRLTFRPVACAGSVDPLLPRPPRCRQTRPGQAPCRSAGARLVDDTFTTDATNLQVYTATTATGQPVDHHRQNTWELVDGSSPSSSTRRRAEAAAFVVQRSSSSSTRLILRAPRVAVGQGGARSKMERLVPRTSHLVLEAAYHWGEP